ncbi:MAG: crotonobetaine/carnitine-CoA ligase [Candidatus Azotimanducaceae bacterium]|jgi:crotonobetaine/carnitine-CoA ligase
MSLTDQITVSRKASMVGMDIPWMLQEWVNRTPDKASMIWCPFEGKPQQWSYIELQRDALKIAAGLHDRGVKAGDLVFLHMDNSPEFVVSWYACALLGSVAVSTNTHSVARDMRYFAEISEAVCAITQPKFAELIKDACPALSFIAVTDNDAGQPRTDQNDIIQKIGGLPFSELQSTTTLPDLDTDPERNLSVQFTSGTTSRPKAVLWTHANGLWAGKISAQHMRLRRDDITLIYMPLFHTNAQGYSMLATHWSGGTVVIQPKFSSSKFWDICSQHKVTWASMIPFAFKALMSQPVPEHHMRFWGGPASLPKVGKHFNVDTIGWWGMTETLTHGIVTDMDHPGPHGTLGRVAPEYEIQLRKPNGQIAEPEEKGVLHIRGVRGISLFKEYYRNPEANRLAFDEHGWFDTGDLVRMDENGWIFFSDREKDMLKVGAENVAASEIESVLMQTGLIDECAVVAQKHDMLDEVPVVFVILNAAGRAIQPADLKDQLIHHCTLNLASFKVVRDVHIVSELPRSTLEKVAKNELRASLPPIKKNG